MPSDDVMEALASAISDGVPVDWAAAESAAESDDHLEVVRNLRVISTLGGIHRTETCQDLDTAPAATPVEAGARAVPGWGHFALLDRLGEGSQGEVFRAIDTRLDREVALKFLRRAAKPEDAEHVLSEARLLARVRHPNVITVYGADLIDGRVGMWMELISGDTLDASISRSGPMSAIEAAIVGVDLCRAVAAVHTAGLLHRDIKGQNVMRESGGRYVLMDFGAGHDLADHLKGRRGAGTPLYLAPEVLAGGAASVQSDIYAIGVLLFYLASGTFPVAAWSVPELIESHERRERRRLADVRGDLPAAFTDAVERAIDPDPAARFRTVSELSASLTQSIVAGTSDARATPKRRRQLWIAGTVLAGAVAAAAGWIWTRDAATPAGPFTIAVLPFEDLSSDQRAGFLAEGLSDLVITDLGRRPKLSVLARTSSRQFAGNRRALDLARDLGVNYIVEGSLQPDGDRWTVTARVMTAGAGTVMTSRTFHLDRSGLGRVPHDIADAVTSFLKLPSASGPVAQALTDPEAIEAYVRGWSEYWRLTREGFTEAERLFKVTTAKAPDYAPAHAALAYVMLQLEKSYKAYPPGSAAPIALREAETAVRLDPTSAQALASLGWIHFYGLWDWRGGEQFLRQAVELNPSDAQNRWMYAQLLMAENRLDAALEEARLVQRLDPLTPARYSNIATVLFYSRRYEEAVREMQQLIARDPSATIGHFGLGRFLSALGRHDEAVMMIRTAANANEPPVRAELARILTVAGREADAVALLPALDADYRAGRLAPDYYAFLKLARGEPQEALRLLQEAVNQRSPSVIWINVDPRFDQLRNRTEFLDILRLIGLAS